MKGFTLAAAASALALGIGSAAADEYLGSYQARISDNDHQASDGYQLDSAAQMVRQDRANWHKFGSGDAEDEDDPWFRSTSARARFEKLLQKGGAMSSATKRAIVNGEPVVEVEVYRNSVVVTIIGD
jgi:hypothetical protein